MICAFTWGGVPHEADLTRPVDLSVTLRNDPSNPTAWYVQPPRFEPVRGEGFVGAVAEGGSVNFRDVHFNPHGHGTHTECVGHITRDVHPVDPLFRNQPSHFPCLLVSAQPRHTKGDGVLDLANVPLPDHGELPPALVVRTLPNDPTKAQRQWSNTNPPYFVPEFIHHIVRRGVMHLLVDVPSVDREVDGGQLASHHAFWNVPDNPDLHRSITELVYVPQNVSDGLYLLHLGVAPMHNDAATSRPVLYPLR